ncbi:HNH endonuclease signature motif containing protein [Leptolyngbya sp. FACHB-541]|uniref:HNH endonuclease n=1 Tax=Leptolyngbya sp. FACHB-541 TaxID=2692810 RepID=UPI0018F03739
MCAICGTDLSGLVSLSPIENFDHMVPLARGGLNDVTNLQLLCQPCNLRKRDGTATTSRTYEAWYDMED